VHCPRQEPGTKPSFNNVINQYNSIIIVAFEQEFVRLSDTQGCDLGLGASVSRPPRGLPTPRLGPVDERLGLGPGCLSLGLGFIGLVHIPALSLIEV